MASPLKELLTQRIREQGPVPFAHFMEQALYHPDHGYYSQVQRRAGGEWMTGPTLHPLFGATLARGLAPLLAQVEEPTLVEVGTGSGELMRDLCFGLAEADPDTFERLSLMVVDRSEAALDRALSTLEEAGIVLDDVSATTTLPDEVEGVVVSNELLDAMPVHAFQVRDEGPVELLVGVDDDRLVWTPGPPSAPSLEALARRIEGPEAPMLHRFEVPRQTLNWYDLAARSLRKGALLTIDYGAPSRVLLEQVPKGTIHGYHHGRPTTDVLVAPGELDLTYLVPFDLVAAKGEGAGLATALYAPQGLVLEALGLPELARRGTTMDLLSAKKLIDPAGAGGTFQVLVQARGVEVSAPWPQGHQVVEGPETVATPWLLGS